MKIKLCKTGSTPKGLLESVQLCCNLPVICPTLFNEHVPRDCMQRQVLRAMQDFALPGM